MYIVYIVICSNMYILFIVIVVYIIYNIIFYSKGGDGRGGEGMYFY